MSRDFLKKIIKEELEGILEPQNPLYVFDFDETLVSDSATVYVHGPDKEKRPLTAHEFQNYELQPGETLDYDEFNDVTEPKNHEGLQNILRQHLDNSAILTARSRTGPVRSYMNSIGLSVPEVIAVGDRSGDNGHAATIINAKKKRDWIDKAIQERGLDYVEFWDDNDHNIENVLSLQKKYPEVKIICHLVRH